MIQFYAPEISQNPVLPESDSQHCIKVLRKGLGDIITVIDGCGRRYQCRIVDPHPKHAMLQIIDVEDVSLPWCGKLTLAVAPTKHLDRMEWLVEKAVEIGIDRFVPLLCSRSERKELKTERLEKIAISAMKQSLKASMPEILPMTPIQQFISTEGQSDSQRFVAYCDDSVERRLLAKELLPEVNTTILIGPEGDFSPEEIQGAIAAGFLPVTLGDCRLRTETAALVALQTVHVVNQLINY